MAMNVTNYRIREKIAMLLGKPHDISILFESFRVEAEYHLGYLSRSLLQLGKDTEDLSALDEAIRCVQTLKGASITMEFREMRSISEAMENLLEKAVARKVVLTRQTIHILFEAGYALAEILKSKVAGSPIRENVQAILQKLYSASEQAIPPKTEEKSPPTQKETKQTKPPSEQPAKQTAGSGLLTDKAQAVIVHAAKLAMESKQPLHSLHLLLGLLETQGSHHFVFKTLRTDIEKLKERAKQELQKTKSPEGETGVPTLEFTRLMKQAVYEATLLSDSSVGTIHLLLCLFSAGENVLSQLLKEGNLDYDKVKRELALGKPQPEKKKPSKKSQVIQEFLATSVEHIERAFNDIRKELIVKFPKESSSLEDDLQKKFDAIFSESFKTIETFLKEKWLTETKIKTPSKKKSTSKKLRVKMPKKKKEWEGKIYREKRRTKKLK